MKSNRACDLPRCIILYFVIMFDNTLDGRQNNSKKKRKRKNMSDDCSSGNNNKNKKAFNIHDFNNCESLLILGLKMKYYYN